MKNKYSIFGKKPVVEGKSKKIYQLSDDVFFMVFKPHLRSITYNRESDILGTEHERLVTSLAIMKMIEREGINTQIISDKIHIIDGIEGILVKEIKTIPIEFISRYYASGSIVRLYPSLVKEMDKFKQPLFKYDLKQDISVAGVDDPTLNESYIIGLELLTEEQFNIAKTMLKKISQIIYDFLLLKNIKLIDMKMEFGFDKNNNIILIDEISQDCIRANSMITNESITKDAYRKMKSDEEVLNLYKEFSNLIIEK